MTVELSQADMKRSVVNKNKRQASEGPPTLEQRIIDALRDDDIGRAEIDSLITETEKAIGTAGQDIAAMRSQMLDVQRCTNPAETKQRIAAAELHCDRLEAVLPKLRDHLRRAIAREQHAQWLGEYRERLSDYNSLAQQLNELDDRQDAIDAERHKLNNCADAYNQVAGAINRRADELREARQLPRMELSMPPGVVKDTGKKWGPPKIAGAGLAVAMAKSMVAVPAMAGGVGPYWNDPNYRQAQRDAVARQQAEIAAHYELMRREQEERINQEIQQQQQRGTR